jgi:endoglucanase
MVSVERLEPRTLFATGTLSEQIIVDQFGWRSTAGRKVALFADPVNGQNGAIAYTPGSSFQVKRASDDSVAFTGTVVSWKAGATDPASGDRVWSGDFSAFNTPGEYYICDPTNALRSYPFRLEDSLYNDVLKTSVRTYYYQRTGTAIDAAHGGNWTHAIDHVGPNQDTQSRQWQAGTGAVPGSPVRNVAGGWFDAGDYNKYVPFTTGVLWNLLTAFEWNPAAFGDDWNIPESGNAVPDILDEVKYELDWLRKMQLANGSVMNRVANATYAAGNHNPATDTQSRYYTAATTWATASFAASLAHASRVFAQFDSAYPGYAATLRTAAEDAWGYLQAQPTMFPTSGTDGGGSGGSNGGLAAAGADANAAADLRVRILAAAELYKTTGNAACKSYFESNYKNSAGYHNEQHPLLGVWPHFDPTLATDLNRAYVTYATSANVNGSIVNEIKTSLRNMADAQILPFYDNGEDPYRAAMWVGHYSWGSNQGKSEWANLLLYAIKLNVNAANNAKYREVAEEYLHYFHGRNPLSQVYLTNMGAKGANLGGDKSVMQPYHSWFGDGSSLFDGANSTYGPVPGYLVGGANRNFTLNWIAPPYGEPPMKAFKDWNTGWNPQRQANENSWEITEPAIYYQAAYTLLVSQFATQPVIVTPPVLNAVRVNDGSVQRSQLTRLTLAFDRPVTLAAGAVRLELLNTGGSGRDDGTAPSDASAGLAAPTSGDGGATWVFTFAGSSAFVDKTSGGTPTGSLADGIYIVSVDPAKVTASGIAMTAPASLTFHRLFGDVNGSKSVNAADYNAFRPAFGNSAGQAGFDPAFDFDNSGTVNALDYAQFRNRFGKGLSY